MEEREAITLLKQGDLAGMEELVQHHQVEAVQTAYLIVGDRSMAEDIAQAAFLKAVERIHQFKDGLPFRPWILRIVTNDAIKVSLRARKHLSLDAAQELNESLVWLRDTTPGPEELAATAENRQMIWEALQQLTPKQRAAIVMRYFLEMRDREIAQELDRPLSSIKWSIHAAKERLRSLLGLQNASTNKPSSKGNQKHGAGGNR
jgi:RNA polymerase sigma-70 factor (ECF subfamily)